VVVLHQPPFCSSCYGNDAWEVGAASTFVPVFDQYATTAHVDLVLQGHRHVFERTYPLTAGPAVDSTDYDACTATYRMVPGSSAGTAYVTTGAGGHSLHGWESATPPVWSASRRAFFHWLKFSVGATAMVGEVHDTQNGGSILESFTLSRASTFPACGADAGSGADAGLDAGSFADASAAADAATPADAGPPDAAGVADTGTAADAFVAPDSGVSSQDAGADAGLAGDSGVPDDASTAGDGASTAFAGSCGCHSSGGATFLVAAAGLLLALRRRRTKAPHSRTAASSVVGVGSGCKEEIEEMR
jgi:MYXO-CTERM domain-containing protein